LPEVNHMIDLVKRLVEGTSLEYGLIAIGICAGVLIAVVSALLARN
jgi:Flp pilus assembly pilin Flp